MSFFWYQIIGCKEKTIPTHYKSTAEEIAALSTFIKLTRGAELVGTCLFHRGTTGHLPTSQFGVLESLSHLGPMCQSDIGSKLLKSNSNITFVIHNLEKRGLVRREWDVEDRGMVIVWLPPKGCELNERIFPIYFDDETGGPGTILTFFPWPRARGGRWGNGQVAVTSFSIPKGALAYWKERL